jgi:hypothetical protein
MSSIASNKAVQCLKFAESFASEELGQVLSQVALRAACVLASDGMLNISLKNFLKEAAKFSKSFAVALFGGFKQGVTQGGEIQRNAAILLATSIIGLNLPSLILNLLFELAGGDLSDTVRITAIGKSFFSFLSFRFLFFSFSFT